MSDTPCWSTPESRLFTRSHLLCLVMSGGDGDELAA